VQEVTEKAVVHLGHRQSVKDKPSRNCHLSSTNIVREV